MANHLFNVGIRASDDKDYDNKIDVLCEALMQYDFVTDVMDWKEEFECHHKWRKYEKIGIVCRDCGESAPDYVVSSWED
jgi:hypothetical protein